MGKKLKILIIDDDESIRDSLKWHFEDLGYEAIAAEDPTVCPVYHHEKCTAEAPCADVIFIDQNMPKMTGLDFIKRQAERGCKLPACFKLLMTGTVTADLKKSAESLGCQIAQKPFPLAEAAEFILRGQSICSVDDEPRSSHLLERVAGIGEGH